MQVKGIVEVTLRNKDTLEVEYSATQENTITSLWRNNVANASSKLGDEIVISTSTDPSYSDFSWISTPIFGYTAVGVTSPQYFAAVGNTPTYIQWKKRFDPPPTGTTRNISTVGLATATAVQTVGREVSAYVHLNSPCVQTDTQLLDVTYRVQWIYTTGSSIGYSAVQDATNTNASYAQVGNTTNPGMIAHNCMRMAWDPTQGKYNLLRLFSGADPSPSTLSYNDSGTVTQTDVAVGIMGDTTYGPLKRIRTHAGSTSASVGKILASEFYVISGGGETYSWSNVVAPTGSNVQPIQSHAASTFSQTTATPFLDTQPATGTGKLIGGGTWTRPDYPEEYMIKITGTGAVGTSTYQMWKRNHFGFLGTTWKNRHSTLAYLTGIDGSTHNSIPGSHGMFKYSYTNLAFTAGQMSMRTTPYGYTKVIFADNTGITVVNLTDGTYVNYDASTTPALPVTSVHQVSVDNSTNTIWVACSGTGLWKISSAGTVVTHITAAGFGIPSDIAYGVDIGRNSTVWAMCDGGLTMSADGGSTWTTQTGFSFVGISDNNWNTVTYIKTDPSHPDDQMAIMRRPDAPTATSNRLVWWSRATATSIGCTINDGTMQQASVNTAHIDVSDTGSLWMVAGYYTPYYTYPRKLTYGTSSATNIGTYSYAQFPLVAFETGPSGQPCYVAFDQIGDPYVVKLYDTNLTVVASTTVSGYSSNMLQKLSNSSGATYMGKGVLLGVSAVNYYGTYYMSYTIGAILDTDDTFVGSLSYLMWDKYGWNGTTWVKNNAGSKPTHTSADTLLNGVTLAFQDGASGTSFVTGEYYTFGVVDGILKDNSIAYTTSVSTYPFTTKTDTTFSGVVQSYPSTGTVTWRNVSNSLTVNPNQSLVNTVSTRNYGLYAISNNRVFGDFSITGTFTNGNANRRIQIGLTPFRGSLINSSPSWTNGSGGNGSYLNERTFELNGTNGVNIYESSSYRYGSTFTGPVSWEIRRVGSTLTYWINGINVYSTTDTTYSYVVRVMYATPTAMASFQETIPPITVASSGTGYYVRAGSSGSGTGSYDPNFLAVDIDPGTFNISLNGTPVTSKLNSGTVAPAAGEVNVCGAQGDFLFNAADVGKTVTGSYVYVTK